MPEEERLQASSESRHRGCGRDVLRQTVPSTGGGNREGITGIIDVFQGYINLSLRDICSPCGDPIVTKTTATTAGSCPVVYIVGFILFHWCASVAFVNSGCIWLPQISK